MQKESAPPLCSYNKYSHLLEWPRCLELSLPIVKGMCRERGGRTFFSIDVTGQNVLLSYQRETSEWKCLNCCPGEPMVRGRAGTRKANNENGS